MVVAAQLLQTDACPATNPSSIKLPVVLVNVFAATFTPIVVSAVFGTWTTIASSPLAVSFASVSATVSVVAVTAVTWNVPLFAAFENPDTVILCPTLNPSSTKLPLVRVNVLAVLATRVPSSHFISTIDVGSSGNARISAS